MFWVHSSWYDKDFLVYSVTTSNEVEFQYTKFLVYTDTEGWQWIASRYCTPIESTL